jgi:formylmethanofuran dehydrogenase subunit E
MEKAMEKANDREGMKNYILEADESDIVTIRNVTIDEPEPAEILESVDCEICGEKVMETRIRELNGNRVCIPCSEK